jgi:tetratricopeptide (TPR) repeat protein
LSFLTITSSHAYFSTGKYQEAHDAYQNGLKLDPNNEVMKSALVNCKSKLNTQSAASSAGAAPRGMPGMPGLGGGPGGMDFGSLMSNPAIMNMANQLMGSGALNDIMSNPQFANM